jgi:excisionase family DNA binding protein
VPIEEQLMPDGGSSGASPRFLKIGDVASELATSESQVYALLRSGELQGIQIGGRKQWRIERAKLEEWIAGRYRQTAQQLAGTCQPE